MGSSLLSFWAVCMHMCVCNCKCVCTRACMRVCECACVYALARTCIRVCVCVFIPLLVIHEFMPSDKSHDRLSVDQAGIPR